LEEFSFTKYKHWKDNEFKYMNQALYLVGNNTDFKVTNTNAHNCELTFEDVYFQTVDKENELEKVNYFAKEMVLNLNIIDYTDVMSIEDDKYLCVSKIIKCDITQLVSDASFSEEIFSKFNDEELIYHQITS
jgi:hypothetical protein